MFSGDLWTTRESGEDGCDERDDYACAPYIRTLTGIRAAEIIKSLEDLGTTRTELERVLRYIYTQRSKRERCGLMTGRERCIYRLISHYGGRLD